MSKRLGFDIDGVLYPWHEVILGQFMAEGRVSEDFTVGDLFGEGKLFESLPKKTRREYLYNADYCCAPVLREGAKDIIDALKREWEIFYITARPSTLASVTRAWAWNVGLPDTHENLYVADGGKRAIVRALGVSTFVEDHIKYVQQLHDICTVILLTRPWNKDYDDDSHVRIDTLHELVPLLNGGLNDYYHRNRRH